ncbi:unnamed protein product [Thelazia callipaeda]|uniref:ULD domain-containing protein n=1 Tax=Thelazia callipaeda TaxID=103827 RepID=A0A0N5D5T2_THECL|nr:unnamed protein product [Thelazia callipaeda]
MFPVRVVVESVRPQHCLTCARDGHMLVDSYAIVSGATLLSQLVDTVLSALGMPQLAVNSKVGYPFIHFNPIQILKLEGLLAYLVIFNGK